MPGFSGLCDAWADSPQEEAIQRNGRGGAQGKTFKTDDEGPKSLICCMHRCLATACTRTNGLSGYMLSDCKKVAHFLCVSCVSLCSNAWQHLIMLLSHWHEERSKIMRRVLQTMLTCYVG